MTHSFKITVAPNGARRTKADHPTLPMITDEIAATAKACFNAGADGIHLHVRDDAGVHSLDAGRYRDAMAAIAQVVPQMDIQITTEAAGIYDASAQYQCLTQLIPKAASVSVREMARDINIAKCLYAFGAEAKVDVQYILYNADDIAQLAHWMEQGIVPPDMKSAIFVLGQYSPQILAQPGDLQSYLNASEMLDLDWTICAFGQNELACARAAMQAGGNLRIGFENNLHRPDGSLAKDNADLVTLTVNEGRALGLTPTSDLQKVS